MELKDITPRLYQEKIFASSAVANTLVILPTGMGKTAIALMLAIHRLKSFPNSKVLFLAPTKPLCEQHIRTFEKHLDLPEKKFHVLTGAIKPEERKKIWNESKFIFATPQTITNDLISNRLRFDDVSLMVVDEAHRAIGDYDYVFLAKAYVEKAKSPRLLALTASPGSDKETIETICKNLFIEKLEIRGEQNEDVAPYVQKKEITEIRIDLPDSIKELKELFEKSLRNRLKILKEQEVIETSDITKIRKRDLLLLQVKLASNVGKDFRKMQQVSMIAACIKIIHCLELLQTQGIASLVNFLETIKIQSQKTKASRDLINDLEFREAMQRAFELEANKIEHPKFDMLKKIVEQNAGKKIIIFTNYRNTADTLVSLLKGIKKVSPVKFIGQKSGLTQKEQVRIIEEFKAGDYNVLIATCIAEEGLHIENADIGIFFEPVPSALRTIQRRGRIGRTNIGKVYTLITKDTVDEKYHWAAFHKERRMHQALSDLKEEIEDPQKKLTGFVHGR
jgi:Fanconi anemia group M protein